MPMLTAPSTIVSSPLCQQMPMLTTPSTIVSSPLLPAVCVFIVHRLPCLRLFHRYDLPLIFQAAPRKLSEKIICRAGDLQSTELKALKAS
ncbi:unnamed protein product [Prunus armeniaca]|uniref:Uncharacterized protein n=1 Tax=Prunus armeniaca TaxID=36596 RepID=A0A6J5TRT8_PRUAR|nr:unnamed protein product [Prunus armeniaca]